MKLRKQRAGVVARFALLAFMLAGGAARAELFVVEAGGVRYVNPFFFAETYGGTIEGRSLDSAWTVTVNGRRLRLNNNSRSAALDGRSVTLAANVGYARGTLLAPLDDLLTLFGVDDRSARTDGGTLIARQALSSSARPVGGAPSAAATQPAVRAPGAASSGSQPTGSQAPSSQPAGSRAPGSSGSGSLQNQGQPAGVLDVSLARSSKPLETDALANPNFQLPLQGASVDRDIVVRACQEGVGHLLGVDARLVGFTRAFLYQHPQEAYALRGTVTVARPDSAAARPFTCFAQRRAERLVMHVAVQGR